MRKHIRLRDFDYSSANAYFVTICVQGFECVFGEIRNGIVGLSEIGNAAAVYMQEIEEKRNSVLIDEFIVMPNHVHCIIDINKRLNTDYKLNQFAKPVANSVSVIVNRYKGAVKRWGNDNGYLNFNWQSRFHDHVIRNNEEYWLIKNYIMNNPANWKKNRFLL